MKWGQPWSKEQVDEHLERFVAKGRAAKAAVDSALQASNSQRNEALQRKPADKSNQMDKEFRLRITHVRRRITDRGGIDYKPAVDGFRPAGIWLDDSPKHLKEITEVYEQGPDQTVIEVWEILKR